MMQIGNLAGEWHRGCFNAIEAEYVPAYEPTKLEILMISYLHKRLGRHLYRSFAAVVVLLILTSGCGSVRIFEPIDNIATVTEMNTPTADPRIVQVQISGDPGIPGWREFTVHESGLAIVRGHKEYVEKRGQLSVQDMQQLSSLFSQNGFLQLPNQIYDKSNAAAAMYNIFYNSGKDTNTVNTNNAQMNPGLNRVVETLAVLANQVLFDGLTLELTVDRTTLRKGETLTAQLVVRNEKAETISWNFSASQLYRFTIRFPYALTTEGGVAASASRSIGQERPPAISVGIIRPGETQRYSLIWDGRNEQGQYAPGTVFMQAEWLASPGGITAAKAVTVE
jgi:hypothetical protein